MILRDRSIIDSLTSLDYPASQPPSRVVIENVRPEIDGGRFPIRRTVGEDVVVTADIHADSHDVLTGVLRHRKVDGAVAGEWEESPLTELGNDRWRGQFQIMQVGRYEYALQAWIDEFSSWRQDLTKRIDARQQDLHSELLEGAEHVRKTAESLRHILSMNREGAAEIGADADWLAARVEALILGEQAERVAAAIDPTLARLMGRHADRTGGQTYERGLTVAAERERARVGAWYEMFPRSAGTDPNRGATLREAEARLPAIAAMGFDVLYLPPIHPIGQSFRKGPNNTLNAGPNDPGSPWAIGTSEGGHKSVHPDLGTLADFDHFIAAAKEVGIEIALDIAFQCSPDHPYVREHPDWFRHRPDGSIKYAENPPKKYQDIYPLDFECQDWRSLWEELKSVVVFWIGHGIRIFRVDNPHTKPFRFWEWLIRGVQAQYPDAIVFLAEAFTRPKVMQHLAKSGFTQSYTYFTWRNTKEQLTQYFTELSQSDVHEYMRPNLFANTPDILPEYLQYGGRPAFQTRLVLAATLGASYGIYGPPFELCEARALRVGGEEYLDSEKYQIHAWDWDRPENLREFIARVNQIRRDNPALHSDTRLRFYNVDSDEILFYGKTTPDLSNIILVVVNLDPHHTHAGWVQVPLDELGLENNGSYQVHDVLSDARYLWHGTSNFVSLDPNVCPASIFLVRRRVKTERDFDYFM